MALVVEREEEGHALKVQHPVYYISEVLTESKTRYLHIQKMVYAILIGKRKLWHYFDAHPITIVTEHTGRSRSGPLNSWVRASPTPQGRRSSRRSSPISSRSGQRRSSPRPRLT